jgi:hypothetical protein
MQTIDFQQPSFDFDAVRERNLRLEADEWIARNPAVFKLFEKFALQMAERGRRFGVGQLTERVRWECRFSYEGEDYKINNNHRAYIARRLVEIHPQLENLIEMRKVNY